jgi:transposase
MGKQYDKEFKTEAVRLASEPGNTQIQIQRDLGIGQGMISRWKRELKLDRDHAFPFQFFPVPDLSSLRLCDFA